MSVSALQNSPYYNKTANWSLEMSMEENSKSVSKSGNQLSRSASSAYGGNSDMLSQLNSIMSGIMDDMNLGSNDKVTFKTLMDYRDQLQDEFTKEVKAGLAEAGVAEDATFRLTTDDDGKLLVISEHEDAEEIEKYFAENSTISTKFEKLQGLNKLEETRKTNGLSSNAMADRAQIQSMTNWFSNNSSFMSFTEQSAALYSGINVTA